MGDIRGWIRGSAVARIVLVATDASATALAPNKGCHSSEPSDSSW